MRVGLVRNVGLSITALAVLALGGCNDNPLNFNVKDTVGIQVNPSEMVVAAGRTSELESRAVNQGNEPTFDAVSAAVDATCGPGAITVVPDPAALEIQPPGLYIVTGGAVLGQSCVVLTSGSNTAQVDVTVVADGIAITAPADGAVFRAGETGQVVAGLTDLDGNAVGPYAAEDAVFTSSDADVADYTDDMGSFSTETAGTATLGVTWAGQAANGTAGLGVVRSDEIGIEVIANVPASAAFDNEDDFGAVAGGETVQAEVLVLDQFGNQNTDETEITGCTVLSSDPAVATATCTLDLTNSVNVLVDVTTVAPGGADISGTVTTSEAVFNYGPASIVVLSPSVTGISTATGFVGTAVTISGTGLAAAGFDTEVLIDGSAVTGDVAAPGFVQSVSDTDVTILMPDLGNANDAFEVGISVGGVVAAETFTYTQLADAAEDEPANDNGATPTVITLPTDKVGSFEGIDVDDYHLIAVTGAFTVDLDWDDHSVDLDILIDDETNGFSFPCGFDGATGAAPEQHVCDVPAGNYLIWINNYSGPDHPTSYRLEIN
jgi:hypothetical protein